ncbi:L,D-transpeptidase family protein [Gymnodinialimonas sp. 57CJ19]|uniref:L,D-transpeptidase family protein n=1 Tax=Gymnodinialimonas sp. 57CJ19 TaxID=3138498 RepID=UPI0031345DC3
MSPHDIVLTPTGLRFWGASIPYTVGRGGVVADKREGDGGTPVGIHRVVGCLYRADRGPKPCPWAEPIGPNDLWSDDDTHAGYNLPTRRPFSGSSERLARGDSLYDIVLVTDWNWPDAQPGKGSAIFIHQWRGPFRSTEGCVAVSRENLRWMMPRIALGTRLIVPEAMAL